MKHVGQNLSRAQILEELDEAEEVEGAELQAAGVRRVDDEVEDEDEDECMVLNNPWSQLEEKYRQCRVEVDTDKLLFDSEGFSVSLVQASNAQHADEKGVAAGLVVSFDTPSERTSPACCAFSSCWYAATCFPGTGQWMQYRSM